MALYVVGTERSVRHRPLSTFRKHLRTTVFTTMWLAASAAGTLAQEPPKYVNADGTRTNDLEAAKQSWRDDAEFNGNDGLGAINADAAYAAGYTGQGTKLGVIDQPVWGGHPEFAGRFTFLSTSGTRVYTDPYIPVEAGDPFVADGRQYIDGYGEISSHGTHVAGIAGANRDGAGMMGVAFGSHVYAATNFDPGPEDGIVLGNDGAVYGAAWQAMIDSGVDIVTDSWGIGLSSSSWSYQQAYGQFQEIKAILGTPEGGAYDGAIKAARSGIVVEFSAGNDGGLEPDAMAGLASFVPDIEKYWLTTMSVVADDENPQGFSRSGFSSICGYTKYHCVAAPGSNINSSIPEGDITGLELGDIVDDSRLHPTYAEFSGTSMAGPFATGAFAVLKERFPYLANGEVNEILKTTATDLGDAGVDDVFGWGLIDLDKALNGPGQFLSRFEANLPGSYVGAKEEIWSNDISQDALNQRKAEDAQTITDWEAKKITEGWQNGVTEESKQAIRDEVIVDFPASEFPDAIELVRVRYAALDVVALPQDPPLTDEEFEAANAAFEAADAAMLANPAATALWNAFVATAPNTSIPRAPQFVTFKDTPAASLDTIRGTITDDRIAGALAEFDAYEALVPTLTAKLGDPDNYAGGLTKSGAGTLRLTGDSTYQGDTLINGGLLAVDGSLTSKAVVNATGTLGGVGSVGGIVANSGGIVAPGNSVGTLTSNGDVTFNGGSTLHIEVNGTSADQLVVNGAASLLGGVVMVTPETSAAVPQLTPQQKLSALLDQTYTILTSSGGITGTFDQVVPTYAFIDTTLAYAANDLQLTLARNGLSFADLAVTRNQKAAAAAIEAFGQGNAIHDTIATATVFDNLAGIYQSLSGEIHATLKGVLAEDGRFVSQAASDRVRAAFGGVAVRPQATISPMGYGPETKSLAHSAAFAADQVAPEGPIPTYALWGQAYGSWADADSDGTASGYNRDLGGIVTGFDGLVADSWRVGLLLGYGNTSLDSDGGHASVDSFQIGLYGGTQWDAVGLRLGATYAHHEIDTDRSVVVGGLASGHSASYDAQTVQVFGELGYRVDTAYAALEPFVGARYVHLETDGFEEDGLATSLSGQSGTSDVGVTTLGLRASRDFSIGENTVLTARGMVGWNHAFGDVTPEQSLAFAGGQAFNIEGLPIAEDALVVEAGFDVGIGTNANIGLSYTGQFSGDINDNGVKADLTIRF